MSGEILTVIIVNYKTADLVSEVAQGVKKHAQADGISTKTIVVDNGSRDGSVEKLRAAHPEIAVIDTGANLGFAAGNNVALRALDTPYALLLNSDAFLQDGCLARLIAIMEQNPQVGICGPRILNPDGTDQDYPERFPSVPEMIRRALFGPQFPAQGKDPRTPIEMERIHGCALLIRRSVVDTIGLLDERFWMYDEDMDWCLRAREAGWRLWLVPDAQVMHLGGQTSGRAARGNTEKVDAPPKFSALMTYELRKSRYRLYHKHCGAAEILLLKIFTDAMMLASIAREAVRMIVKPRWRAQSWNKIKTFGAILWLNPFRMGGKKA